MYEQQTSGHDLRFMVWENVPGALSSNKGEDFRRVLEEIVHVCDESVIVPRPEKGKWKPAGAIMGDNYSVAWRVLDARWFGVPQRRKRIALVADFGGRSAPEILLVEESLRGNPETIRVERETTTSNFETGSGTADGRVGRGLVMGFDGYNSTLTGAVSSTLGVNCGMSTGRNGVLVQEDSNE